MTDWTIPGPLRLLAPAKVNLGLEILEKRSDGYHEVVTLMESISIFDRIDLEPATHRDVQSDDRIDPESDLIARSIEAIERHTGLNLCLRVTTSKTIPIAAGLGGGSSDAGTLIAALGQLLSLTYDQTLQIAAEIGSDVPFFLNSGMALATGTGTTIQPVQLRARRWYLILVPDLDIPGKTARLYGELDSDDFSDGSHTRALCSRARISHGDIVNAFQRPLLDFDHVRTTVRSLHDACGRAGIASGAGPSVFVLFGSYGELVAASRALDCPTGVTTYLATSVGPHPNQARIEALR